MTYTPENDVIARHYDALDRKDFVTWAATMADNVLRRGPFYGDGDVVTSKADYVAFVTEMNTKKLHSFRFILREIIYSPDKRRAFVLATEHVVYEKGDDLVIHELCLHLELNDDALITKVDVYWKTPSKWQTYSTVEGLKQALKH